MYGLAFASTVILGCEPRETHGLYFTGVQVHCNAVAILGKPVQLRNYLISWPGTAHSP
jgi:hypothetical protein